MSATDTIMDCAPAEFRIEELMDRLDALSGREVVTVRDLVSGFGSASFVPVMLVSALVVVSPLSGIPFLPSVAGMLIGIAGLQTALGRRHLWLPGAIMRRGIEGARLHRALCRVRGPVHWVDRVTRDRFRVLVAPPADRLICLVAALCGFTMPFLELFPFSSSFLGLAVALLSTAYLTRDGLFVILGLAQIGVAGAIIGAVIGAAT